MKKVLNGVFILLAGFFIALVYSGLFADIEVREGNMGPYILVYESHTGDYSKTGDIQNRIYEFLRKKHNVAATKGFGLYYDDPESVPSEKLRSIAGCVLEPEYRDLIPAIKKRFNIKEYPVTGSFIAEFPYRNQLSIFLGVTRVYPVLDSYRKQKGYKTTPAFEVYDLGNEKILYSFPIEK